MCSGVTHWLKTLCNCRLVMLFLVYTDLRVKVVFMSHKEDPAAALSASVSSDCVLFFFLSLAPSSLNGVNFITTIQEL